MRKSCQILKVKAESSASRYKIMSRFRIVRGALIFFFSK
jgi:hypothetical protein